MNSQKAFYAEIGRRIRDARRKRNPALTQDDLAQSVGLTRTSITNVEHGRQKCLLHTFVQIAAALQIDPANLLPSSNSKVADLNHALKNRDPSEKQWIMSAVAGVSAGKAQHGA